MKTDNKKDKFEFNLLYFLFFAIGISFILYFIFLIFPLFNKSIPDSVLLGYVKYDRLLFGEKLLLKELITLCLAILFFTFIVLYGRKYLNKNELLILISIILSGVSLNFLETLYMFNINLLFVIILFITMFLCHFYLKNKKILYLISIFVLCTIQIECLFIVVLPFILVNLMENHDVKKMVIMILTIVLSFLAWRFIIFNNINFINNKIPLISKFYALGDNLISFFGFNTSDITVSTLSGSFIYRFQKFDLISAYGMLITFRFLFFIIFVFICPFVLYKNYKKNDKCINRLLTFNTFSWIILFVMYLVTNSHFYSILDLGYFIFNYIISLILVIYFMFRYGCKYQLSRIICTCFLIMYIVSNICITFINIFCYM